MANRNAAQPANTHDALANWLFVALAVSIGGWLAWDVAWYRLSIYAPAADYWEHTATLTEWLRHFAAPSNPHVASADLSPRYMPWYWLLTVTGLALNLNSIELMGISAIASYALIVIGLYLFARAYFRHACAPLVSFIVLFMCWGISWNWSNLYQLRSFFYIAGFPSSFCFGLCLIAFWVVLKQLRGTVSLLSGSLIIAILAALMFLVHPLTAVFGLAGCGLLALTELQVPIKSRIVTLIALTVGIFAAELWPFFSPIKLSLGMYSVSPEKWFTQSESPGLLAWFDSGAWKQTFYDPRMVLIIFGPALLGIPLCVWMLFKRELWFISMGALLMSVPYFANFLVQVPLAHRFLLFVVFFLHLALIWAVLKTLEFWRSEPLQPLAVAVKWTTAAVFTGLVTFNVALLAIEFTGYTVSPITLTLNDKRGNLPDRMSVVELYSRLTGPIPDDAVVLTTARLGWPLPTFRGKTIALLHENPMLLDQIDRFEAMIDFHSKSLSDDERSAIAQRFSATHALVNVADTELSPEVLVWLGKHARLVAEVSSYRMYELTTTDVAIYRSPRG